MASSKTGPTPAQWEAVRPIIHRLYIDENKPLCHIMEFMRSRGHIASIQMYKKRIAKWKFQKYSRNSDMMNIAQNYVAGRIVKAESVNNATRYFKRKGYRSLEHVVGTHASSTKIKSSTTLLNPLGHYLTPPEIFYISEKLLSAVSSLVVKSVDEGFWICGTNGLLTSEKTTHASKFGAYALGYFVLHCWNASRFFQQGLFVKARQMLSNACAKAREMLEHENPRIIPSLLSIYVEFNKRGFLEAAQLLFRFLKAMASQISSIPAAMSDVFEVLTKSCDNYTSIPTRRCVEDIVEQHYGRCRIWIALRLHTLIESSSLNSQISIEESLRTLLRTCQDLYGKSDRLTKSVSQDLTYRIAIQKFYPGVENLSGCSGIFSMRMD